MGIIRNPSSRYRAPSVTTSAVGGQPRRVGHILEQEITLELSHVCPNKPRQCQLSSAHNGDVALIWDPSRQVRGSSRDDVAGRRATIMSRLQRPLGRWSADAQLHGTSGLRVTPREQSGCAQQL